MRYFFIHIGILLLVLSACDNTSEHLSKSNSSDTNAAVIIKPAPIIEANIENPLETKKLKLLITNNINSFYLYKGETLGLEYELLKLFLDSKHIELEIEFISDLEHIRDSIHSRGAHMAAATFIIPKNQSTTILYSAPIYTTDLVLVKHKNNTNRVLNPVVIKDAPYVRHLWSSDSPPTHLTPTFTSEYASKELLLREVHGKTIESTIADSHETALIHSFFSDIVIDTILEKMHL